MSEQKLNEDGLVPGALVSAKDHAKVLLKQRQEAAKKQATKKAAK